MQLLETTQKRIGSILNKSSISEPRHIFSGRSLFKESLQKSMSGDALSSAFLNLPDINILEYEEPKLLISVNETQISELFGNNIWGFKNISIGSHPDFQHLTHNQYCYHYCVSMFVDIKGSTRLSSKYSALEIRQIKDTLLSSVIVLINLFGGHVQRLQGDGAMVQFVRVGQHPNNAIINALNAASVLCFFVQDQLSKEFINNGVDPLKIRIGVDYGQEQQVVWSHYGIPGCTELTTTSLHTDLAAKLQQKASANAILIGDNIKKALDLPDEFYDHVSRKNESGQNVIDRYIFNDNNYAMYQFKWINYLLSYPFFKRHSNGKELLLDINDRYSIKCEIGTSLNELNDYKPNSMAIPKGYVIKYTLLENNLAYKNQGFNIKWIAENRGLEANKTEKPIHDFNKTFDNKIICETSAAYLGHHYLKCKIERASKGLTNINLTFPIYVL